MSLGLPPAPGADPSPLACSFPLPGKAIAFPLEGFPLHRLTSGGLHEIKPDTYRDGGAAIGFALAVLAEIAARRKRGAIVLWCLTRDSAREWGRPYGPGLLAFGLDPASFLIVEARTAQDAAFALEEGLKSRAVIGALAEIEIKTPLASRRLGLAAQTSRTPCLLLSKHRQHGLPGTLTRWRVGAAPSPPAAFDANAPGAPAWQVTLERCRGGAPGRSWSVEFSHGQDRLRLSAAASDRAAEAGESGGSPVDAGHVRTG